MGVFAIDAQGRVRVMNRKMRDMLLGSSAEDDAPPDLSGLSELVNSHIADKVQRCMEEN